MKISKILVFIILAIFVCVLAGCSTIQSTLDVPENLHVENGTVRWNSVDGAMKYLVFINGNEESSNGTSFDLSSLNLVDGETYTVKVKAVGDGYVKLSSEYSEEISFIYDGSNTNTSNDNTSEEEEPIIEEGAYSQFTDINVGSSYLGYGYDVVNDPYIDGEKVNILNPIIDPEKLNDANLKIAKNLKNTAIEIESQKMEEFSQKYGASLNVSGGIGFFSGSLGFNYKGSMEEKSFYYFYMCSYMVKNYNIYLTNTIPEIKDMLSDNFMDDLKNMEASALFDKYGTHMIRSASMGGRLDVCATYSAQDMGWTNEISAEIKADIKAIYSLSVGASGSYSEQFKNTSIEKEIAVTQVGGTNIDIGSIGAIQANRATWFDSFNDINNSTLCGVVDGNSLVGLWELLPSGYEERANELKSVFTQQCEEKNSELCSKYLEQDISWTKATYTMNRQNSNDGDSYNPNIQESSAAWKSIHDNFELGYLNVYGCDTTNNKLRVKNISDFSIKYHLVQNISDLPRNGRGGVSKIANDDANKIYGIADFNERIGVGAYWIRVTYDDDSSEIFKKTNFLKDASKDQYITLLNSSDIKYKKSIEKIEIVVVYEIFYDENWMVHNDQYTNWRCSYTFIF